MSEAETTWESVVKHRWWRVGRSITGRCGLGADSCFPFPKSIPFARKCLFLFKVVRSAPFEWLIVTVCEVMVVRLSSDPCGAAQQGVR